MKTMSCRQLNWRTHDRCDLPSSENWDQKKQWKKRQRETEWNCALFLFFFNSPEKTAVAAFTATNDYSQRQSKRSLFCRRRPHRIATASSITQSFRLLYARLFHSIRPGLRRRRRRRRFNNDNKCKYAIVCLRASEIIVSIFGCDWVFAINSTAWSQPTAEQRQTKRFLMRWWFRLGWAVLCCEPLNRAASCQTKYAKSKRTQRAVRRAQIGKWDFISSVA